MDTTRNNYPATQRYYPSMYSWEKEPRKQPRLKVCAICGRNLPESEEQ